MDFWDVQNDWLNVSFSVTACQSSKFAPLAQFIAQFHFSLVSIFIFFFYFLSRTELLHLTVVQIVVTVFGAVVFFLSQIWLQASNLTFLVVFSSKTCFKAQNVQLFAVKNWNFYLRLVFFFFDINVWLWFSIFFCSKLSTGLLSAFESFGNVMLKFEFILNLAGMKMCWNLVDRV